MYSEIEKQGRLLHKNWSLYDGHHVVFERPKVSARDLQREVLRAACKFFSIPRIIGDALRLRLFDASTKILIDRQLGHTSPGGDAALKAAWSLVGRAHYTDMNMLAGDARRSAEAVRKMLDRAEAELMEDAARGDTALVTPPIARMKVAAN